MRSLTVVVLLAWGGLVASAQTDPEEYVTQGLMNGRGWRVFSEASKSIWIDAYKTGALYAAAQMTSINAKCSAAGLTKSMNFKIRDTVEGIDFFYQDPANLRIPIVAAIMFLTDKMDGKSALELDRMLTGLRKSANK